MGRKKLPVDVIEMRGKSHMTKAEKDRRRAEELAVPSELREVRAPDYVREMGLGDRFDEVAGMLARVMPDNFCALDAPMLAQYVVFEAEYEEMSARVFGEFEPKAKRECQRMQVDAFNGARAAASALGMFVTDRCRISATPGGEPEDDCSDII